MYLLVKRNNNEIITHVNQCENSDLYELRIKVYPTIITRKLKRIGKYKENNNNNRNNKNQITEKCINILITKYDNDEEIVRNEKNIYCPFHENSKTSNSKSGKFHVKLGLYICYSTKCPVKKAWGFDFLRKISSGGK